MGAELDLVFVHLHNDLAEIPDLKCQHGANRRCRRYRRHCNQHRGAPFPEKNSTWWPNFCCQGTEPYTEWPQPLEESSSRKVSRQGFPERSRNPLCRNILNYIQLADEFAIEPYLHTLFDAGKLIFRVRVPRRFTLSIIVLSPAAAILNRNFFRRYGCGEWSGLT